jgi:hypothetical protein
MADKVPFGMALLGSFNSPKIKIYRWVNNPTKNQGMKSDASEG